MDADQRLVSLKKAYADILLNTSKEAAARVVASEKKAVRLEKELNGSKEQALQMLLRLKRMMDCKVMEAEMTHLNQQRIIQELNGQLRDAADTIFKAEATSLSQSKKIEELEAQLNEAEDIVKDLREELKEVHIKLKKARKYKPQSNETVVTDTKETEMLIENLNVVTPKLLPLMPEENTLETSQPVISSVSPVSHNEIPRMVNENETSQPVMSSVSPVSHNEIPRMVNENERNAFIPSILLKSKGPEFCGNRRTQRIRAFEEKLMAGELTFNDGTYDVDASNVRNAKVDVGGGAGHTRPVEKIVKKSVARSSKWRKYRKCGKKKKISSTKDLYSRSKKIEEANDDLSEEIPCDDVPKVMSDTEEKTRIRDEKVVDKIMDKGIASMGVEKVDVPAVVTDAVTPGTADGGDDQPVTERVFKYTFQRKRKRENLNSSDGSAPAEESALKESTVEISNCPQEEKCSSDIESSRDSRRLALVAHQLLSLSEKKW